MYHGAKMAIKFIPKKYYTFAELAQRWACELADLRHAVLDGIIVPSIFFHSANHHVLQFEYFNELLLPRTADDSLDEEGYTKANYAHGFKYLINPYRETAFDGQFSFFSDKPTDFCVGDL